MTDILWVKFTEDTSLPADMTEAERTRLEEIFSMRDGSLWTQALQALRLPVTGNVPLLFWHHNYPYINWTEVVRAVTVGWIKFNRIGEHSYQPALNGGLLTFFRFLKTQWSIGQYTHKRLNPTFPLPVNQDEQLVESLALGLAILSLTLRLPPHDQDTLAQWLSKPELVKPSVRRTLEQLQALQKRRTALTLAWHELFPPRADAELTSHLPNMFWNTPTTTQHQPVVPESSKDCWKGRPVSGGLVSGQIKLVTAVSQVPQNLEEPCIFVMANAKPEAVELYDRAAGILFAEGGALAHACIISREQNLPCVTALGQEFLTTIKTLSANGHVWVSLNGQTGEVQLIKS